MSAKAAGKARTKTISGDEFLRAAPYVNEAMTVTPARDGGAMVTVSIKRPGWLVPPLSWILPYSLQRRIKLDAVGYGVLKLCDGRKNVETIIEQFAQTNKLSFRESQLSVSQFLRQMTQRGIIAIVGTKEKPGKP